MASLRGLTQIWSTRTRRISGTYKAWNFKNILKAVTQIFRTRNTRPWTQILLQQIFFKKLTRTTFWDNLQACKTLKLFKWIMRIWVENLWFQIMGKNAVGGQRKFFMNWYAPILDSRVQRYKTIERPGSEKSCF